MRASRLLSILMLLQTRGRMTAGALAGEFEVSVRTIYRDIDQLSAAGVPVYADRGPSGGFELLDGYRTKLTGLSPTEAATLFLAGLPGPAAELGLADVLTTAQLKLTAALPEGARETAQRVSARFHLDPVGWFRGADDARLLPVIANAVWSETCLEIHYKRQAGVALRKVRPLGLVLKGGFWYLVAQARDQIRTYRVAHIVDVAVTEERFERPRDFDLVRFWTMSARAYEVGLYRGRALLRVSPKGMKQWVSFPAAVAEAAAATAGAPDREGWVRVVIPIETPAQAAAELMRLGAEAEVIEPSEVRRAIADAARQLSALYRRRAKPTAVARKRRTSA